MPQDLDFLQGTWSVAALEMDGEKMADGEGRIDIQGNRFTSTGMGAEYRGTLVIDPSKGHLDMKFTAGPEKGNTNLCIYEIKGDRLRICIATRGNARPAKFASTPGSGFAVETDSRSGFCCATLTV